MRLIFVPQYPTKMRYQDWWFEELQNHFRKHFDEVLTLVGDAYTNRTRGEAQMFSPVNPAIRFELSQIDEYLDLSLRSSDILFLADTSFPGLFTNVLYHKKPEKCFAFCHATSLNKYDYFENVRYSKFPVETSQANLFDKVFVGSYYHKEKLNWRNTIVTRLPKPPFDFFDKLKKNEKTYNFVSVARPTKQKVDLYLEEKVMRKLGAQIRRQDFTTWFEYYEFLSQARCLLITSQEDTFNYTILDAIMCGCIPIAPNKLCFPEILPREYLYDNENELLDLLESKVLCANKLEIPRILCQEEIDNFYENICNIMKRT